MLFLLRLKDYNKMKPWKDLMWKEVYQRNKYAVQRILGYHNLTKNLMLYFIEDISVKIPKQIEKCCLTALDQKVEELVRKYPEKKPGDWSWLRFEFFINRKADVKGAIMQDELLKEEFGTALAPYADIISEAIEDGYEDAFLDEREMAE